MLGLLAMPFGFDGCFWRLMGDGIDWMIAVALWVASLPGAVGRMAAFGIGPLLLGTAGLVRAVPAQTPLRLIGALLIGACVVLAVRAPQPDVLISPDGSAVAVRGADGRLADGQIRQRHLRVRANGSRPTAMRARPKDATLGDGHPLRRGRLHRQARRRRAGRRRQDHRSVRGGLPPRRRGGDARATAPPGCAALVIDRQVCAAIRRDGAAPRRARASRSRRRGPPGYDRPWARATLPPGDAPDAAPHDAGTHRSRATRRRATEDLEAADD